MTFRSWKLWMKQLPFSLKWFVVLILLRPIIDVFYFLKEISPLFSPLYVVGILTPILVIFSFLSKKFPRKFSSFISDVNFGTWSVIVLFNLLLLIAIESGFSLISDLLRYSLPIILYFYIRHFIRSKSDLIGLLQTFFYSAYFPAAILLYELLVAPINPEYLSEGRGGGARIQGAYADIMNYAIYAVGALIIQFYFFLKRSRAGQIKFRDKIKLITVVIVSFVGLIAIKQSSSWGVVIMLLFFFLLFNLNSAKGFLIIVLLFPILFFGGRYTFKSKIEPLIEKEYKVIEGEADIDRSFNGRMSRWIRYFDIWAEMPVVSNFLGTAISAHPKVPIMISGGMHNDFVRVLFLSGIIGLIFYLSFLFYLMTKIIYMKAPEKFLVLAAGGTIFLYSISTTPLLYPPLLYTILPIFAYAALPKTILLAKNV